MSARVLLAAFAFALAPAACSVAALEGASYNGPRNDCSGGCGDTAACIEGECRASSTTYPLFVEITPPATAAFAPGVTFAIELDDKSGGARDFPLPGVTYLSIGIDASEVLGAGVPLDFIARLSRHDAIPGTTTTRYEVRSRRGPDGIATAEAVIPPADGGYDLYITPDNPAVLASLPPIWNPQFLVRPGGQNVLFQIGKPKELELEIRDETGGTALLGPRDGYDISVVDRVTGRTVSTLANTCALRTSTTLRLTPSLTQHTYSVRVAPPRTSCTDLGAPLRPTYEFDLDAVQVEGTGRGIIRIPSIATLEGGKLALTSAPLPVPVNGTVKSRTTGRAVEARLRLRSRKIFVPSEWQTGTPWFEAETQTLSDGTISSITVPSGEYDFLVVPELTENTYAEGIRATTS
jgi:hypothetical protein